MNKITARNSTVWVCYGRFLVRFWHVYCLGIGMTHEIILLPSDPPLEADILHGKGHENHQVDQ